MALKDTGTHGHRRGPLYHRWSDRLVLIAYGVVAFAIGVIAALAVCQ